MDLAPYSDAIKEAARTVPALVLFSLVLGGLVYAFLKHITKDRIARDAARQKEREAHEAIEAKRAAALEKLGDSCHEFQREIHGEVKKVFGEVGTHLANNTKAMIENTMALTQSSRIVKPKPESEPPKKRH